MKLIILLFIVLLCGIPRIAEAQQSIQFIYIGSENGDHDSVLITTANPYDEHSKSLEGRLTKVYYIDQTSIDSLRSFITRIGFVTRSYSSKNKKKGIDALAQLDVYKIIGAAPYPLYVEGRNCYQFFISAWGYFGYLGRSVASNAMFELIFQCHEEFLHRDLDTPQAVIIEDPYHRLKAKPNH
jgi:hypothetical protein